MNNPEVRFTGQEFEGAEAELGNLGQTFRAAANDQAVVCRGGDALRDPSDIEITPTVLEEPLFIVNAWHQTEAGSYPGIL